MKCITSVQPSSVDVSQNTFVSINDFVRAIRYVNISGQHKTIVSIPQLLHYAL